MKNKKTSGEDRKINLNENRKKFQCNRRKSELENNRRTKVIFLGDVGVGKSTLSSILLHPEKGFEVGVATTGLTKTFNEKKHPSLPYTIIDTPGLVSEKNIDNLGLQKYGRYKVILITTMTELDHRSEDTTEALSLIAKIVQKIFSDKKFTIIINKAPESVQERWENDQKGLMECKVDTIPYIPKIDSKSDPVSKIPQQYLRFIKNTLENIIKNCPTISLSRSNGKASELKESEEKPPENRTKGVFSFLSSIWPGPKGSSKKTIEEPNHKKIETFSPEEIKMPEVVITTQTSNLDKLKDRITKLFDSGMDSEEISSFFPSLSKELIAGFVNSLQNPSQNEPLPGTKLLPPNDDDDTAKNFGFYHLPSLPDFSNSANIKTFIVLGETGSGKTTLIDSISNYILDVQLNDPFRYKVVDESYLRKTKTQASSQTDDVTIYKLEGRYGKIQIIDTPGFGDTRGIETDELITKKIADLFKTKLESLDYILFVVKSTDTRLTDRAHWIHHKMQELFGVDMAKNIVIMATFCDGGNAKCVQALKDAKIPHSEIFYFNNSGIMTCPFENDRVNQQTKRFWRLGMDNFKIFMDFVKASSPVSLSQTKDVIKYRESIELTIKTTQDNIELSQTKIANLEGIMRQICDIKDIQKASENYVIDVEEPQVTKEDLPPGQHTTTCLNCSFTCHEYCRIPENGNKKICSAIDPITGNCKQCPSKCFWDKHANLPYVFKYSKIKKQKTLDDLKKKYYDARNVEDQKTQLLNGLCTELKKLNKQVLTDFETIRDCMIALDKIALKPHGFEFIQYLKGMIHSEQTQKRDGYEGRVKELQKMEKRMSELQKIHNSNDFQELLPKYEKDIDNYHFSLTDR